MLKPVFLKSGRDFENIFEGGRLNKNESVVVYRIPVKEKRVRIGICVGKSLGTAVRRNRLKRQFREILRSLEFKPEGFDAVLVARKRLIDSDYDNISSAVRRIFKSDLLL